MTVYIYLGDFKLKKIFFRKVTAAYGLISYKLYIISSHIEVQKEPVINKTPPSTSSSFSSSQIVHYTIWCNITLHCICVLSSYDMVDVHMLIYVYSVINLYLLFLV